MSRVYTPGDFLCDLHDGMKHAPDDLVFKTQVQFDVSDHEMCGQYLEKIKSVIKGDRYINKHLIVIGVSVSGKIVAAGVYDDRILTIAIFEEAGLEGQHARR